VHLLSVLHILLHIAMQMAMCYSNSVCLFCNFTAAYEDISLLWSRVWSIA